MSLVDKEEQFEDYIEHSHPVIRQYVRDLQDAHLELQENHLILQDEHEDLLKAYRNLVRGGAAL